MRTGCFFVWLLFCDSNRLGLVLIKSHFLFYYFGSSLGRVDERLKILHDLSVNKNRSDKQLIIDYFNGDQQSLEVLIQQYLKPMYNFVYRYVGNAQEAEDITQEVFVRMWRNLKRFNQKKSFKTWIFSIAKNASLDFLKKRKTIPFSEFNTKEGKNLLIDTLVDPTPLPQELLERAGMAQMLTLAIKKLSSKYRMVLFLSHTGHFNFREIAESLGEQLHTVKSRHRRALIMMRSFIQEV